MSIPREFGRLAKKSGINAPTLDEKFSQWLLKIEADKKLDSLTQWWEGWYEALYENLARQSKCLLPDHTQHSY